MGLWSRKAPTIWRYTDNFSVHLEHLPPQTILGAWSFTIEPFWFGQLIHTCIEYVAAAGPGTARFAVRGIRGNQVLWTGSSTGNLPASATSRIAWTVTGSNNANVGDIHHTFMLPDNAFLNPGDRLEFLSINSQAGDIVQNNFATFKRWELP